MNEYQAPLNSLIGFDIKIICPGPQKRNGVLIDIKEDYLVLKNEKEMTHYIKLENIKELTKSTKDLEPQDLNDYKVANEPTFLKLLNTFENEWLFVSRDGSEAIQGFVSSVHHKYITFVINDEISFIPISQIASCSSNIVNYSKKSHQPKGDNNSSSKRHNKRLKTNHSTKNRTVKSSKNKVKQQKNKNRKKELSPRDVMRNRQKARIRKKASGK